MVEIPLSKRGLLSIIGTAILIPILGGFLSAFGEDIYYFSKSMVVESQFLYVILPIIILICIGIGIGLVLIVYDIHRQRTKRIQQSDINHNQHPLSIDDFEIEGESAKSTNDESKRDKENKWRHFPSNSK